jgi:ElaB/YqjD/DUF883 family membrane-anchored ribosome-binding protein
MPRNGHAKKPKQAVGRIQDDLQSLRDDVTHLSEQMQSLLGDAGKDVMDDVMSRLGRAKETVDALIEDAGSKGKEAARAVVDLKENLVDEVETTVRERPITALAIAMGVGFLLSSTLRR